MVKGQSNISTSIAMAGMIAIGIVGFLIDVLLRRKETGINRRRAAVKTISERCDRWLPGEEYRRELRDMCAIAPSLFTV